LTQAHARIFCPENLIMGVVGDVSWDEVEPLLESMMEGWPSCPEPLPERAPPKMRTGGGVFLIPRDLTQSTVILAEPGGISEGDDPDYFASRIGNSILGAGGMTSRIPSRVRTEMGYAYRASSLWTAPARHEGIVGAMTQTKSESTIAATLLILEIMEEMRSQPPMQEEIDRVVDQMVNGFVFNFQNPAQIVSRRMSYLAQGLPADWLEQFIREIQKVGPDDVHRAFRRHVNPDEMLILILGNPDRFDLPPETLGPVQIWQVGGG
jgi:zinc protease